MRLLTYNLRGGLGMDGRRDMARLAAWVREEAAPDVACFQEVHQRLPWSGWINQPGLLAWGLEMRFVFQACVRLPWGGYGLGIATRLPIEAVQRHRLPSRGETRGALRVQVRTPHGPASVFCTHWGLSDGERARQAKHLAALVNAVSHPVVVCGDFNETAQGPAVRLLLQQTGLQDAGQSQNAPTYPADAPAARIDLLLHSAAWRAARVWTVPSLLSDHLPVLGEFNYGGV